MVVSKSHSIRFTQGLDDWLEGRSKRAQQGQGLAARARIELLMWREVLGLELARQRWNLAELGVLADISRGMLLADAPTWGVGAVAASVADAIAAYPGSYAAAWGVDEQALVARLALLGPAGDLALADGLARWWAAGQDHTMEAWQQCGFTVARTA